MKAASCGVAEDRGTQRKLTSVETVTQRCGWRGRSTEPRSQESRDTATLICRADDAGVSPAATTSRFRLTKER